MMDDILVLLVPDMNLILGRFDKFIIIYVVGLPRFFLFNRVYAFIMILISILYVSSFYRLYFDIPATLEP